jgi:hypothetical protein
MRAFGPPATRELAMQVHAGIIDGSLWLPSVRQFGFAQPPVADVEKSASNRQSTAARYRGSGACSEVIGCPRRGAMAAGRHVAEVDSTHA